MRSSRIVLALPLILAALPASADTSFTGTGWLIDVPLPGILCANNSGQVYLKGNVHRVRILADDARITGRIQGMPDVAFQPDGTRLFTGRAYSEVGTWDAATNFTASGGVWDLLYRGVTQIDGSIHYDIVGYGIGGPIDGLRTEITANRGPGPMFHPSIPYEFSGTIKSAPVNSNVVIDNFDDGKLTGWALGGGSRMPVVSETDGHLTINCDWTGIATSSDPLLGLAWAGHNQGWTVADAQTVELRAELTALNPAADSAALVFAVQQGGPNYVLLKGHDSLLLLKQNGTALAALCGTHVVTPDTGVVMSLALTKMGQNLALTGRVFDKATPANVLGQIGFLDTPASDPVLSSQDIADLLGGPVAGFGPDPGPFWTTGQRAWLGVWQYTDGTKPAAEAVFDNLQVCTYEVPTLGIERVLRISWPAMGMNWTLEAAPTVQGPFQLIQAPELPGMHTLTLPANDDMRIFRVRPAP